MSHLQRVIPNAPKFGSLLCHLASSEESLHLGSDKTLGFALECVPLPYVNQEAMDAIMSGLKSLVEGAYVQIISHASDDIASDVYQFEEERRGQSNPLLKSLCKGRASFLKNGVHDPIDATGTMIRVHKLYVTVKVPITDVTPNDNEEKELLRVLAKVKAAFERAQMFPRIMDRKRLKRVLSSLLNHGRDASWRSLVVDYDDDKELRHQVLDINKSVVPSSYSVKTENAVIKTLSPMKYPPEAWNGLSQAYIGDLLKGTPSTSSKFFVTATIYFPDHSKAKSNVTRRYQITTNQHKFMKYVPQLQKQHADLRMLMDDYDIGERPVEFSLCVCLLSKDEETSENDAQLIKSHFATFGMTMEENNHYHLPFLANSLPLNTDDKAKDFLKRERRFSLKRVMPFLPVYGEWRGNGSPALVFNGRLGQMIMYDLFHSDTNFNLVVAAQSGSGKSFATNYLVSMELSRGTQVWIIDVGRSYKNLCETLGGKFSAFTPKSTPNMNPFAQVKEWDEDEQEVVKSIIEAMPVIKDQLDDVQTTTLRKFVDDVWVENGHKAKVDHIIEKCAEHEDPRIRDLATRLYDYGSTGPCGKYFNGDTVPSFNDNFSVLELEELKGRKHLQKLVLMSLIFQIQNAMYMGNIKDRKMVVIDEAWDLLAEENVSKFIEHGYRRFRKYNGSACIITQSVNDLYSSQTGEAIASNSAHKWMLKQTGEDIDKVQTEKRLSLSEGGFRLFKTVHTSKGNYSEILFINEGGCGIGRLIVDPFTQLMFSTDPKDKSAIASATERLTAMNDETPPINQVIELVLAERRQTKSAA
ncbi:MAG: type IV secretion system protein TraC [Porticoccaceae bacterium]